MAAGPVAAAGDVAAAAQLDAVLAALTGACRTLAAELAPFLPGLAARVAAACATGPRASCPHPSPCTPGWTPGDRCPVDRL